MGREVKVHLGPGPTKRRCGRFIAPDRNNWKMGCPYWYVAVDADGQSTDMCALLRKPLRRDKRSPIPLRQEGCLAGEVKHGG